ncbi:hypothetical protein V6N13_121834 [Hibiscus sabdariffa]|uniref:PGG domain-containing protein n=1 Tax=Hibiscus sabdariffa TaxID=183260 RepID=A0ABR2C650_9ROSI
MEIISLKSSFATKLNHRGLSPMHLAVEKGQQKMALRLLGVDRDLVRVRGKNNISCDDRNALLVILALLLTASYQATLSPPGGLWQGDSSSNSTVEFDFFELGRPGSSIMYPFS